MQKWWNWLLGFLMICLMFIAIPLTLTKENSVEQLKPVFDDYIQKFNKSYRSPEEYDTRFRHFMASMRVIENLNAESKGPDHIRAKYGLTKLSDMSPTEFKEIHLSDEKLHKHPKMYGKSRNRDKDMDASRYDIDGHHNDRWIQSDSANGRHSNKVFNRKKRALLPLQVDWRTKGVIGPVRNQGLCGACWAFSTVGTMEAMAAIKTGVLDTLSVQEVIDCAGLGNSGCAGGDICLLLDWLYITQTPIQKDKEYPLRLMNGVCKKKTNATGVYVKTFTCDDEDQILQTIATHGPVTVAVNALTWQNYLGGVIQYHCSGSAAELNHAVELVGYDLSAEVPHYIVKNSWGKDFGIDGYLNLAIGSNICGLANEVAAVDIK